LAKKKQNKPKNGRKKGITPKNAKFIDEYIKTSDLSKSWIAAGYSENNPSSCAAKCLKKPQIKREYKRRLKEIGRKVNFDAIDVINELGKIAFSNSDDYIDWHEIKIDKVTPTGEVKKEIVSRAYLKAGSEVTREMRAAISGIKETINGVEVKFHSKTQALESLKKYFGIDDPREIEKAKRIKDGGGATDINITITRDSDV